VTLTTGTDIVSIKRFIECAQNIEHPTLKKVYTQHELDYCFSKSRPESHLAVRFAGKEAVIKALYSRGIRDLKYTEVEIINKEDGVPFVNLDKYKNLNVEISLSHCEDKALAFVIIWGDDKHAGKRV